MGNSNVFLIGPMGAGKSTIGRYLADRMSMEFVDTDREIEAGAGVNIPTIFDFEGEAGFRARESRAIDLCTRHSAAVVATGGGAVLAEENRRALRSRGIVVYLHTDVDEQVRRTQRDRNRPLLQTDNPRARLEELMQQREPIYRELADIVVTTDGRNPRSVANQLARRIMQLQSNESD